MTLDGYFSKYPTGYERIGLVRSVYAVRQELLDRGIELIEDRSAETVQAEVVLHLTPLREDILLKYRDKVHIYYAGEPMVVYPIHNRRTVRKMANQLYDSVVTNYQFTDDRVIKTTCPNPIIPVHAGNIPWERQKLACMITNNKFAMGYNELYSARRQLIRYFEKQHPDQFDFYGTNWERPYTDFTTYKGYVSCKIDCCYHYRFVFCFSNERSENMTLDEKIFDCMIAGCVPIYYGTKMIGDFIPSNCYIDYSEFDSIDACYQYIASLKQTEYNAYLEHIADYLVSQSAQLVHPRYLAESIQKAMALGKRTGERNFHLLHWCIIRMKLYGKLMKCIGLIDRQTTARWCKNNGIFDG
ncbi:MAG: glycosyltransferase family 10 [Clostridia bacterium]